MSRQPNPITRQIWGIEPRSPKRRIKMLLLVCVDMLVYLIVWGCVAGSQLISRGWPSQSVSRVRVVETLIIAALFAGIILALRFLGRVVIWDRFRLRLHRQWEEWHLSGITGRQMLFGLGSPAIVMSIPAVMLHLGASLVAVILYLRGFDPDSILGGAQGGGPNADWWGVTTATLMTGFAIIVIHPLNMALVAWGWNRALRAIAIFLFIVTGPMLVASVLEFCGLSIRWPLVAIIEIASWIPRGIFAWWLPLRAARALDQPPRWIE